MIPEIKNISVITITDEVSLTDFKPSNTDEFEFTLRLLIGPKGMDGEESFDVTVCTPKWLQNNMSRNDVIIAHHYMIMMNFNVFLIQVRIENFVSSCSGKDWNECAMKLSRLGAWEFEDYH